MDNQKDFIFDLFEAHRNNKNIPSPDSICNFIKGLLQILFPELSDKRYKLMSDFENDFEVLQVRLEDILRGLYGCYSEKEQHIKETFFHALPTIRSILLDDADAMTKGDPAAVNVTEVIRTYPGFYAIAIYRLAHQLYLLEVPLIPRILTEHAHQLTGIDIHPGATIGEQFCIDHGTGIVIGGTANIGNNVKIYQGVTLGALSVKKELAKTKRHPTIEDNVVIYAGATILGGETVIGANTIIGGNVWLTKSVLPYSRIYFKATGQEATMNRNKISV